MSTQPPSTPSTERNGARAAIHPDAQTASAALAESFAEQAIQAVGARSRFSVALTGGSGPVRAYRLLGEEPFRSRIPWEGVHLFWGDERCVPPGHARSNFRMANEAFISRVPIPPANVHRMCGELGAREGAAAYARELEAFFGPGVPRLDLIHLGVGPDGHVASLFPFSDALRERGRTVTTNLHLPLGEPRLTLTLPVLNAAARIELPVMGAAKAVIAWTVLRGPIDPFRFPAQFLRPADGEVVWVMDAAAASRLGPGAAGTLTPG
ncbi:MAG TPA: 6-phosphogluconolactonase [Longimicrobium sp.]|nr:6-phosphogluconolactonase [Longimicrobium sp.]